MPISIALLLCIPIGLGLYYEGRWLIRSATGRWGVKERRGALAFGIFGGLLIPIIHYGGLADNAISGKFQTFTIAGVTLVGAILAGLAGWAFVRKEKGPNNFGNRD